MNALHLPRTLFAPGAVAGLAAELDALGVRRPLIVTDKGIVAAGLAARVMAACGDAAVPVLFDAVTENPLFADADAGAACFDAKRCDGVIAVGGGSVIDTAKLIALLATNPGRVADYAGVPGARIVAAASLVAIPTTAGTGSEASPSAGLHPDASTPSVGISSRHLVPRLAVLDPELTASLPPRLTAATGIGRVARHLRGAVSHGADMDARAEMMMAAFAGGVSIGMGLGPAHALALACSDQGFHHGVLSGIGLVATLDATARQVPGRMAQVNGALGLPSSASTAQGIAMLMRDLGLPTTLAQLGYVASDAGALAEAAARSHFNLSAPLKPSAAQYAEFFARSLAPSAHANPTAALP